MAETIKKLTIEGFKSIRKLEEFELGAVNVLIGANGAGKSNFVSFFRLLRDLIQQRLQTAIAIEGGADSCLFLGPKETRQLAAKIYFGQNGYEFSLVPTHDGRMVFSDESTIFYGSFTNDRTSFGSGHAEAKLKDKKDDPGTWGAAKGVPHYVFDAISSWVVYHFHDTSFSAGVRRPHAINNNIALGPNAENLAPFSLSDQSDQSRALPRNPRCCQAGGSFFRRFSPSPDTGKRRNDPARMAATRLRLSI